MGHRIRLEGTTGMEEGIQPTAILSHAESDRDSTRHIGGKGQPDGRSGGY